MAIALSKNKVLGRRPRTSFESVKVGGKKIAESIKKHIFKKAFERKLLLKIPEEILEANPDKHFVWVNLPRLQQSGYYHAEGYQLLRAEEALTGSPDEKLVNHFMKSTDGLVHRNEMVLAYLPKEEYEHRCFEDDVINGKRNLEDIITANPNLAKEFLPRAEKNIEEKDFSKLNEEAING